MTEARNINEQNRLTDWVENSKRAAVQLLKKTDEISERLFQLGDLGLFFSLLARFSYFDYRNILLIAVQYPRATDLASLNTWRDLANGNRDVLKNEFKGKGINLLAPFTETKDNKPYLTWFTVKLYDISQTSIVPSENQKSPYLTTKKDHEETLTKAFRSFVANEFGVEYIFVDTDIHIKTGRACYSKGNRIYIKSRATQLEQLAYLSEFVVQRNMVNGLSDNMNIYLSIAVRDCLFEIWNLPKQVSFAPPYEEIAGSSLDTQRLFLNRAQQWVRTIEDFVLYEYMAIATDNDVFFDEEYI